MSSSEEHETVEDAKRRLGLGPTCRECKQRMEFVCVAKDMQGVQENGEEPVWSCDACSLYYVEVRRGRG